MWFLALLLVLMPLPVLADEAAEPQGAAAGASTGIPADHSSENNTAVDDGAVEAAGTPEETAPAATAIDENGCERCQCQPGTLEFYGPLSAINTHPPNLLFLSPPPENAAVLDPGRSYVKFKLDYTNVIILERDHGTYIFYDYEGMRAAAEYHKRMGRGEFSAQLPFYYRAQGWLDPIMADWHKLFGLPNGLRNRYPDRHYRYTIIKRDGLVYSDGPGAFGLGDLALGYKYPLWNECDGANAASVRVMAKAPLGNPDFAMGSGNWDASLGVMYQRQIRPHLRGYVNIDYVWTGAPEWDNIQSNDMLIHNWMLEYAVSHSTSLVCQYRMNTNPLRTGNKEADKDAQELTLGFNHRIGPRLVWSGGFVEDAYPETAPDFVLSTDLKWDL